MKHKQVIKLLGRCAALYSAAAAGISACELGSYLMQNRSARGIKLGKERSEKGDMTIWQPWSERQRMADPSREQVKLYALPSGKEEAPYVLYLPGGGYAGCNIPPVVFPCAAQANALGYHAFVLSYRVRRWYGDYAPLDDLKQALRFIEANADRFGVKKGDYMLAGFSAGGNLAGLFASGAGEADLSGLPKPGALALIYPWVELHTSFRPTGRLWDDLALAGVNAFGTHVLLGNHPRPEERERLRIHRNVTGAFPPVYLVHGSRDFMVPKKTNSDQLALALQEAGVPFRYRECLGLTHGFGLGLGTNAEGWQEEALAFWRQQAEA